MDHTHEFAVERMCQTLGVSTSGYYKWRKNRQSKREYRVDLEGLIRAEFEKSKCTYGSPRIADQLNEKEHICSKSTVARYMKDMRIAARRKKKFKITTDSDHNYEVFENLLDRKFEVNQPGKVWVSDITYIRVSSFWMYLTVVIPLYKHSIMHVH